MIRLALSQFKRKRLSIKPAVYSHRNSRGVKYYLHKTTVTLRDNKRQTIYFFRKDIHDESLEGGKVYEPCQLPDGFTVRENLRNGFLTVARIPGERYE